MYNHNHNSPNLRLPCQMTFFEGVILSSFSFLQSRVGFALFFGQWYTEKHTDKYFRLLCVLWLAEDFWANWWYAVFLFASISPFFALPGECNSDYVQFGRDILFITSFRSNKYSGDLKIFLKIFWLGRFCGSIRGLTVPQPFDTGVNSSISGGREVREDEKVKHLSSSIKFLLLRRLRLPRESTRSQATRRWTSGCRLKNGQILSQIPEPPPNSNYVPKTDCTKNDLLEKTNF